MANKQFKEKHGRNWLVGWLIITDNFEMKPNESRLIAAAAEAAVAEISSNCCCFFGEREVLDESTWFLIDNSFVFAIFKKAIIVL